MKRLCTLFLLGCMLCANSPAMTYHGGGGGAASGELIQRAEQLLSKHKESEALQLFEQALDEQPENYTALTKAAMLHCRIGDRYFDETSKARHFEKAKAYAYRAYELQPEDAESNYVMAMSLGCAAMAAGPKERLQGINQMKSFLDAALNDDATHAGSLYLLGRWHFKMANLNFAEKAASKLFFGGVCGEATNQKAADAIEQAIVYDPQNIRFYHDLASVYKEMNNTTACISTLERALTVTSYQTKEELEMSRRCKLMLQELKQL